MTKRRDVEGEPSYLEIMTMDIEFINIFVARYTLVKRVDNILLFLRACKMF